VALLSITTYLAGLVFTAMAIGGSRLWRGIWRRKAISTAPNDAVDHALFILMAVVFSVVVIPWFAWSDGGDAQLGLPTRRGFYAAVTNWEARAAVVVAAEGSAVALEDRCVLYLGQADGVMALYNPKDKSSWRVPVGSVTVQTGGRLSDVGVVPRGCREPPES
jgi:hypothetical protein